MQHNKSQLRKQKWYNYFKQEKEKNNSSAKDQELGDFSICSAEVSTELRDFEAEKQIFFFCAGDTL